MVPMTAPVLVLTGDTLSVREFISTELCCLQDTHGSKKAAHIREQCYHRKQLETGVGMSVISPVIF